MYRYASPEMLLGQKYSGREVDIWSLGVILYSLLCGGLPFDDDDDFAMRAKVIHGVYAEPEWLSPMARDLIRGILRKEPGERLSVRGILGHPWFTQASVSPSRPRAEPVSSSDVLDQPLETPESVPPVSPLPTTTSPDISSPHPSAPPSSSSEHSGTTDQESEPTTPDVTEESSGEDKGPFTRPEPKSGVLTRTGSQATITTSSEMTPRPATVVRTDSSACPPVMEEEPPVPSTSTTASFPSRTPVRTKRRSVSSALSPPPSPPSHSHLPPPKPDLLSLLDFPYPVVFTTPLERELLNGLSMMGFDTGQMVHSVLTCACDSSAAIWWMLRRKAERREESRRVEEAVGVQEREEKPVGIGLQFAEEKSSVGGGGEGEEKTPIRTELAPPLPVPRPVLETITSSVSASELLVRPTPPHTPPVVPKATSSSARNSPAPMSLPERDSPEKKGKGVVGDARGRSGSITILQRASTVLGAAGLGKKRSGEILKEELAKEKEGRKEGRSSDEGSEHQHQQSQQAQSLEITPWTFPHKNPDIVVSPTPAPSPSEDTLSPLPTLDATNRRGFMSTLKMWWQDDRRKRKPPTSAGGPPGTPRHVVKRKRQPPSKLGTGTPRHPSSMSRRSSSVNSRRSSMASVHKDFVLPSSLGVGDVGISRQRSDPSRRSFTPTSDRGEFITSRPASVRSASFGPQTPHARRPQHGRHGSSSSLGSAARRTQPSPLQQYHRRAGSGSSVKVVRQIKPVPSHQRSDSAASSVRSPSRPSSFYATTSPFVDDGQLSDVEELNTSPVESPLPAVPEGLPTASSGDERIRAPTYQTVLVAKARPTHGPPSASPYVISKRDSWRKSWGPEPPGWSTRSIQAPPAGMERASMSEHSIRDVFAGKYGGTSSEDDEWVDEDDDPHAHYAGGLGQSVHASTSASTSTSLRVDSSPDMYPDSPVPFKRQLHPEMPPAPSRKALSSGKQRATNSRNNNTQSRPATAPASSSAASSSSKGETSFAAASGPPRARRQLPGSRGGPALRSVPIQEEDEGE